jgi:hypothetical protein
MLQLRVQGGNKKVSNTMGSHDFAIVITVLFLIIFPAPPVLLTVMIT